jgi:hypothetical protein
MRLLVTQAWNGSTLWRFGYSRSFKKSCGAAGIFLTVDAIVYDAASV